MTGSSSVSLGSVSVVSRELVVVASISDSSVDAVVSATLSATVSTASIDSAESVGSTLVAAVGSGHSVALGELGRHGEALELHERQREYAASRILQQLSKFHKF